MRNRKLIIVLSFFVFVFSSFLLLQIILPKIEIFAEQSELEHSKNLYYEQIIRDKEFKTFNDELVSTSKSKILIINFWASWCLPCLEEFPSLDKLYEKFKNQGLQVLAINTDTEDIKKEVTKVQKKLKLKFPIVLDEEGKISNEFKVTAIPFSIIYVNGKVKEVLGGNTDFYSTEFQEKLSSWLK